jgi:two-component system OmpR family sensor kinase
VDADRPIEASLEPAVVVGDRDRLRQVVDNLLANVRAHTPPGTDVEVGVHSIEGQAVLRVSDTGPGFTEEALEHLFEDGFTTKRDRGGSGHGLSALDVFVRAAGGRIEVDSRSGEGARVFVTLPLADPMEAPAT